MSKGSVGIFHLPPWLQNPELIISMHLSPPLNLSTAARIAQPPAVLAFLLLLFSRVDEPAHEYLTSHTANRPQTPALSWPLLYGDPISIGISDHDTAIPLLSCATPAFILGPLSNYFQLRQSRIITLGGNSESPLGSGALPVLLGPST